MNMSVAHVTLPFHLSYSLPLSREFEETFSLKYFPAGGIWQCSLND